MHTILGTCIRPKSVCHRISYTYYSLRLGVISHVRRCNGTKLRACACVLESATDRPTPTEIWCVVYDFSCESRCILSFPGVSGRDMRTAATPAPDQPGPPKAPPSPARASHPKRLAPLQRIGAVFMPGQSGRNLSLAQECWLLRPSNLLLGLCDLIAHWSLLLRW